jgi:hypothetical protein
VNVTPVCPVWSRKGSSGPQNWEVEKAAMDVQADEAALEPDPYATAIVDGAATGTQGQLFRDNYPTYADTAEIPAVRGHSSRLDPAHWLRVLVVVVAIAVLAAGTVLGLVKAGVLDKSGTNNPNPAQAAQHQPTATSSKKPLVTPISTGDGTATYRVDMALYAVTVTTSTGRSWVSIGAVGHQPSFASIVPSNSSHKEILLGPSAVDVGAGGTKVIVNSGQRTSTLIPASAPFTYHFVIEN